MEISKELIEAVETCKDFGSLVQTYVMLRDEKEQAKREFTEKTAPMDSLLKTLDSKLLLMLDESGQESAKTASGTVYKTTKTSAKVADWNVLIAYVKKHDAYDLLTKNVSKDAVNARVKESGEIVPGVDLVKFVDVGVRRA